MEEIKYKWIVYLTVNIANNKIYIGVHKTDRDDFDNYLGCGVYTNRPATYKKSKTPFQYAVNKYGVKSFKRTTLFTFNNEADAYGKEGELVNDEFLKRPDTYNMILGGRINAGNANPPKAVHMYNISGEFVRSFDSVYEANKFLNPNATTGGHIPRNIKKGYLTKGYQFSYEKVPFMKEYEKPIVTISEEHKEACRKANSKPVGRYTMEGELVEEYPSLKAARLAGYTNAQGVIEGRRNHCKNFIFKYLN